MTPASVPRVVANDANDANDDHVIAAAVAAREVIDRFEARLKT